MVVPTHQNGQPGVGFYTQQGELLSFRPIAGLRGQMGGVLIDRVGTVTLVHRLSERVLWLYESGGWAWSPVILIRQHNDGHMSYVNGGILGEDGVLVFGRSPLNDWPWYFVVRPSAPLPLPATSSSSSSTTSSSSSSSSSSASLLLTSSTLPMPTVNSARSSLDTTALALAVVFPTSTVLLLLPVLGRCGG